MSEEFNQEDVHFMELAMNEAKNSYSRGDLPVGAVITIDGVFAGSAGNSANSSKDWTSHAESSLLHKLSWKVKQQPKGYVKLYTTWEPCLMCTGAAVLSRVDEIIFACPDSLGGQSKTDPSQLGEWNKKHWPRFKQGPLKKESYKLLIKFMKENSVWNNFLENFKDIDL